MCYDKEYLTRQQMYYAKRYESVDDIKYLQEQLNKLQLQPTYYASGFSHPLAPVITDEKPHEIQAFQWGLIPSWCKDAATAVKMSNQTLNARGETIFEKPSFKNSALKKRCLIVCVDGYFEYYHKGKTKFPYFIKLKNDEPITFAGLWNTWHHDGLVRNTYSIVTTSANSLVKKIHNNPNRDEGDERMPVILPKELEMEWLAPPIDKEDKASIEMIQSLIKPYPAKLMEAYTVAQLKGKNGVGNTDKANQRFDYEELD